MEEKIPILQIEDNIQQIHHTPTSSNQKNPRFDELEKTQNQQQQEKPTFDEPENEQQQEKPTFDEPENEQEKSPRFDELHSNDHHHHCLTQNQQQQQEKPTFDEPKNEQQQQQQKRANEEQEEKKSMKEKSDKKNENGGTRERLKRHRREVAGQVWIPEMWGQEHFLKDWIDCSAFDASLVHQNIMLARASLMDQGTRSNSNTLTLENTSC